MIYRLLYKIWKYFWITLFTILGISITVLTVAVLILQLPQSRDYIKNEITTTFNEQFEGTLTIGDIHGFLPFKPQVSDGNIYAPSDSINAVVSFHQAEVNVDWRELLQQNISVSKLEVQQPSIKLQLHDDKLTLVQAFIQTEQKVERSILDGDQPRIIERLNLYAPALVIRDGSLSLDETITLPDRVGLQTPMEITNFDLDAFVEILDSRIFADVTHLYADLPDNQYEYFQASGQFFNDGYFFELNRFQFETANGELDFSFEASPVDLYSENFNQQFKNANYQINITESKFHTSLIRQFLQNYPDFKNELELELRAEGTTDEFFVDRFQANLGESSFIITAEAQNLFSSDLSYSAQIDNVVLHPSKLDEISELYLDGTSLQRYRLSTVRGELIGTTSTTYSELEIATGAGSITLDGAFLFESPTKYDFHLSVDSLDITPFLADTSENSIIQGLVNLEGSGFGADANFISSVDLSESIFLGKSVESLIGRFNYAANRLNYNIQAGDLTSRLTASGLYSQQDDTQNFITDGEFQNLDLKKYYDGFHADSTSLNSTFSANLEWSDINDLFGRVSFEVEQSTIAEDTLRPHQFYADLNSADNETRTLRLTSSFFDGEIEGTITPDKLQKLTTYWSEFVKDRISEEILFEQHLATLDEKNIFDEDENSVADLAIQMNIKDLSLFRQYVPEFPEITSQARFTTNINASKERLLITGNLFDQNFDSENFSAENFNSSFTANFRHGVPLKIFSTVDLQVNSSEASYNGFELKDSFLNISMRNDSIYVSQQFNRLRDDMQFSSTFDGQLGQGTVDIVVEDFSLGTSAYQWRTQGKPTLRYSDDKSFAVYDVYLSSGDEHIEVNGTFSPSFEDSVDYNVRNVNLERISDLIDGRIRFSGTVNGDFVTRSLTQIPSFQGNIEVDEGRILGRLIGDVTMNSEFNPEENQFDTSLRVFTDPNKYPQYLNQNDGIGQDLRFNGYFKIPDETATDEDLYYFDADLREVDMWIVSFIAPTIIAEAEGRANGSGFIRGTTNDYDFDSTFEFSDVYAKPFFTSVNYYLGGTIGFNRSDGLLFREIQLRDTRGGTGMLNGQVDLHDFQPLTTMDLTLDLNNIEFMNNSFDPDVPFYGRIFGTGQVQITGTNFSPLLRTTTPIAISQNSRISIPLEPETEFEQDRRFIQFVDTFDLALLQQRLRESDTNGNGDEEEQELTFVERFTMDLQFIANNPINVRLIFDRVTNDILSANGTGQIRLLLEDQDVSMFGRFNIQGGNYQFVSGEIFTRRFSLQEGGSISWQGDLIDANLDITAVYRARPDISTLQTAGGTAPQQQQPGQRIPIELVLQIGGTITGIENEFFFRIPSGIEGSSDPTIATQISNLNQNEDEKLIQATSILLSGNFIPSSQAQGLSFAEGISGTAAVVNPLITSQVINPLLSNQINSLLRSDVTFDIDVNLNAFNEVDLGVALRLFDDRVILRREGQITGEQSELGDLGATYRINRTFSLTAFHRQDPTLGNTGSAETRQTQEMNGLGVEARVQFNTWKSFRNTISDAVRSLFGIQRKEEQEDTESESLVSY